MRYVVISLICGVLFWILEGIINGNPYAQKVYQAYKPIMRTSLNIPLGFLIYLFYGFSLAGIFLLFYQSLPGEIGIVKGISFAIVIWFFRGVMSILSQWLTFAVPFKAFVYAAITGICESLLLGILFGLALKH